MEIYSVIAISVVSLTVGYLYKHYKDHVEYDDDDSFMNRINLMTQAMFSKPRRHKKPYKMKDTRASIKKLIKLDAYRQLNEIIFSQLVLEQQEYVEYTINPTDCKSLPAMFKGQFNTIFNETIAEVVKEYTKTGYIVEISLVNDRWLFIIRPDIR